MKETDQKLDASPKTESQRTEVKDHFEHGHNGTSNENAQHRHEPHLQPRYLLHRDPKPRHVTTLATVSGANSENWNENKLAHYQANGSQTDRQPLSPVKVRIL